MPPFPPTSPLPSSSLPSKNCVSIALCNVAAASYYHTQAISASDDEGTATAAAPGAPDKAVLQAWSGEGAPGRGGAAEGACHSRQSNSDRGGGGGGGGRLRSKSDESTPGPRRQSHESDGASVGQGPGNERSGMSLVDGSGPSSGGADSSGGGDGGDQYWLMTTGILPEIINGCLATATADVKSNLIKAMNNLMVSEERRAALVEGNKMSSLFELVHGYTSEVKNNA